MSLTKRRIRGETKAQLKTPGPNVNAKLKASNIIVQDRNLYLSKKSEAIPRPIPFYEKLNYQLYQMRHAQSRET